MDIKYGLLVIMLVIGMLFQSATLIVVAIHSTGCSFDGAYVVQICTNESLPYIAGTGLYNTYISAGSYLIGGVTTELWSNTVIFAYFYRTIIRELITNTVQLSITLVFSFIPLIYIIIMLILTSVNGSLTQWIINQPVLYPMVLVWTIYTLVGIVISTVIIPLEHVKLKHKRFVQ